MNLEQYTPEEPLLTGDLTAIEAEQSVVNEMLADGRIVFQDGYTGNPPPSVDPPAEGGTQPPVDPPAGTEDQLSLEDERIQTLIREKYGADLPTLQQSYLSQGENQARVQELEALAKKNINPFASESLSKMNSLVQSGVDERVASRLINTDIKELSAVDALVLDMRKSSPGLSETIIRDAVRQKYGFTTDDDGNEVFASQALMEVDASKAKDGLSSLLEGIKPYDNALGEKLLQEDQEKMQKAGQAWEPHLNVFKSSPLTRTLSTEGGTDLSFEIPSSFISENIDALKGQLIGNNVVPTQEGMAKLHQTVENLYLITNKASVFTQFESQMRKAFDAEVHNGQQVNRGGQQGKGGQEKLSNFDRIRQANPDFFGK
jgi:hypothetical protein